MDEPFIVDGWRAEPALNTFTRGDRAVRVEPKVMELCVRLAQSHGATVSKRELLDSVWPDVIVGEDALTRAVSELRRALDDDARNPRVIETIPKRGYRLIGSFMEAPPTEGADRRPIADLVLARRPGGLVVVSAIVTLAIAMLALGLGRARVEESGAVSAIPRLPVLVAEFEREPDMPASLVQVLRSLIEREIDRNQHFSLVPAQHVAATLRRMRRAPQTVMGLETALEIAERDGRSAAIVTGRLHRAGRDQVLTVQLADTSGRTVRSLVAQGADERALIAAVERDAPLLFSDLTLAAPDPARALPPVTTSSLTALRLFAQAMRMADSVMATIEAPWPTVAELLQKALDEDPEFAMARVWLAYALRTSDVALLVWLRDVPSAPDAFRQHARDSLAQATLVSNPERSFIQGMAFALLDEPDKAIASLEASLWADSTFLEVRTRALLAELYQAEGRLADHGNQMMQLAELRPKDFDVNAEVAEALVLEDDHTRRAAPYIERAMRAMVPSVARRESSCWLAAWLEHLPVYDRWSVGDLDAAVARLRALGETMPDRVLADRDAMGTASGYMWLALGRLDEARQAFDTVGHANQRQWNLALMADLLDDRRGSVLHLTRHGWAYNPLPFARVGLFDRARAIIDDRPIVGADRTARLALARGEEALAAGRLPEAIRLLQNGIDLVRARRHLEFYESSLSLARAWRIAGEPSQALRVLEEAVRERPAYVTPGLAAAWWIKVQVHLARGYREAGRGQDADGVEEQVSALLSQADGGHPWLRQLERGPADDSHERGIR